MRPPRWKRPFLLAALCTLGAAGCASAPRFRDQPVVWRVDDARDIPEPRARRYLRVPYFANVLALRRLTRALELRVGTPAANTNALDEVPDSSWFTNRLGHRALTPEEVARGPDVHGPPQLPLTLVRGKSGGGNPGFWVRDARGIRYLVKFDTRENPEMQTTASVVVNRALWAAGYHVPSDHVFFFAPSDVRLSGEATLEDALGRRRPLGAQDLEREMAAATRLPDGRVRASASELLAGRPVGGFANEGTRRDDPNDAIPHEHRRELRGLRALAAWLGHTDMKEDNTLDMYVEEGGRRFLRHYLIDFGEALGAHQAEKGRQEDGWEHVWDWENNGLALVSFGLWKRPWEDTQPTPWPAIGAFAAHPFEPRLWREAYPYFPFMEAQDEDLFWGAKRVMAFERPMLEALVAAAQLSSPEAAAYLVEALWQRRLKVGHAWLEALSPLDGFTLEEGRLCAVDLGVRHGLAAGGVVERLSGAGVEAFAVGADGRVCVPARGEGAYTVDRLRVRRGEQLRPVLQVHYRAGAAPRVLGLIRRER